MTVAGGESDWRRRRCDGHREIRKRDETIARGLAGCLLYATALAQPAAPPADAAASAAQADKAKQENRTPDGSPSVRAPTSVVGG